MNSGQMFLVVGSVVILTLLTITINNSILNSQEISSNAEYLITGNGVMQSILEEIRSKAFDVATITNSEAKVTDFTPPGNLGPDGETYPNYNDIDDFNNSTISVSTPRAENYSVRSTVTYVDPDAPDIPVNHLTHSKCVSVIVTNPYMNDTLRASYVASF